MVMKVEGSKQFSVMDLEMFWFGLVLLVCCWVWVFNFPLERKKCWYKFISIFQGKHY